MFKKIIASSLLFISGTITSYASYTGTFYLGPSLQYESIAEDSTYQALSPRLTIGYNTPLNESYCLGAEIFAVAGTIENHPTNSDLKNTPSMGGSILPGFMFGQSSYGFARLGIVASDFSTQDTNVWGAQAGIGAEIGINPKVGIRGEYVYTAYQNVNNLGSPKSSSAILGVMYRFA